MRATWVVGLLAAAGTRAAADDRVPVIDVEGAAGFVVPEQVESSADPAPIGLARATVAWELPPLALPAERGAAWRADVGPELGIGLIGNDRRGDGFAEAGLRVNVRFAQKDMGLLRVSARGGLWLAGRAGVVGDDHDTMIEGDLGWYIWVGHSGLRVGWELGALGVKNPSTDDGVAMPLYSAEPADVTKIVHFALFVGATL
jgi:hypothetical protein